MMTTLPEWYLRAEKDIDNLINKIVAEQNINWRVANDSKMIKECRDAILMRLVHIQKDSKPNVPSDLFEQGKKLKKQKSKK